MTRRGYTHICSYNPQIGEGSDRLAQTRKNPRQDRSRRGFFSSRAEAGGFEPPVRFEADTSLAVKPIRPLWHASCAHESGEPFSCARLD